MSIGPPPAAHSDSMKSTCASGCTAHSWVRVAGGDCGAAPAEPVVGLHRRLEPDQPRRPLGVVGHVVQQRRGVVEPEGRGHADTVRPHGSGCRPARRRRCRCGGAVHRADGLGGGRAGGAGQRDAARADRLLLGAGRAGGGAGAGGLARPAPRGHAGRRPRAGAPQRRRDALRGGAGPLPRPRRPRRPLRRRRRRPRRARPGGRPLRAPRRARGRQRHGPAHPADAQRARRGRPAHRRPRGPPGRGAAASPATASPARGSTTARP